MAGEDWRRRIPVLAQGFADPADGVFFSPLGEHPLIVTAAEADLAWIDRLSPVRSLIIVGVDRGSGASLPPPDRLDVALTTASAAAEGWVTIRPAALDATLAAIEATICQNPLAASVFAQVLRSTAALPFADALVVESLAYSMLLAGGEFARWRAAIPVRAAIAEADPAATVERNGDTATVTMRRPQRRNAIDAALRDALAEILTALSCDATLGAVSLRGEGPTFCAGGDLDEFGKAADPPAAHAIRCLRSPAALLHGLDVPTTAHVQGACIGGGLEMAAATRIIAAPDASFRLPEIGMGLIPGAGGTVTLPRRIGRQRTCFMALSRAEIDAVTAQRWGLVAEIRDPP
jgi:hypothetical protein